MTLVSVIVPSNRIGGIDVLLHGLAEQTISNFELIFSDELCRDRATPPQVGRATVQVSPGNWPRWGNYMGALNAALKYARGSCCVFWSDYTYPHPKTLETHLRFHENNPGRIMLGGIEYTELPKLHPDFPLEYGWFAMGHDVANHRDETYAPWLDDKRRHDLYEEWRTSYERDLDSGKLDPFMWSTFEKPVTSFADVAGLRVFNHDRRDTSPFLNLKNDSIPRSLLEKIGGFDERADGCHGHQDSITARQLKKVGAEFASVPENPVRLLDPHGIAIIRRMERDDASNLKIYEAAS